MKKKKTLKAAVEDKKVSNKPANRIPDAVVKAPKGKPITVSDPKPAA